MLIDCDDCAVRGRACADCVVTVLLSAPPAGVELDDTEQQALAALAEGGLVPKLRLVPIGMPDAQGPDLSRSVDPWPGVGAAQSDDRTCSQHRAG